MFESLKQAYRSFGGDPPDKIPFAVWLLENPDSPIALGGAIDLQRHDYLHILFSRGFEPEDEAFIVGITMGNCTSTHWFHYLVFRVAAQFFYPEPYRLKKADFDEFWRGVRIGKSLKIKNLNTLDFSNIDGFSVDVLGKVIGIPG